MKLADKGRFSPPPSLPKYAQRVSEALAAWPNVHARTHWLLGNERKVDGADFYVGQNEIGHIHLEGEAHIFLPLKVTDALVAAKVGTRLPWSSNVLVFGIERAADVERALWLFQLSYDSRAGASTAALVARAKQRTLASEQQHG